MEKTQKEYGIRWETQEKERAPLSRGKSITISIVFGTGVIISLIFGYALLAMPSAWHRRVLLPASELRL